MNILNEIATIDAKIDFLCDEIRSLESAMNVIGVSFHEKVSYSKNVTANEDRIIELIDYHSRLEELIVVQTDLKKQLWEKIKSLPKAEMIMIVKKLYINRKTIDEIAEEMNYSTRQIRRIIIKINEIFEDDSSL